MRKIQDRNDGRRRNPIRCLVENTYHFDLHHVLEGSPHFGASSLQILDQNHKQMETKWKRNGR
jgi:hypothetical protein